MLGHSRYDHGAYDADGLAIDGKQLQTDARRSLDAQLQAAKDVFATSGVESPVREIAAKAGVGVGTVYRHFRNDPT